MPIKASSLFSRPFLNGPIHVLGKPLLGNDVPLFQKKLGNRAQFAIKIEFPYGSRERRERSCISIISSFPSQKMFRHANALPGGYWRAVCKLNLEWKHVMFFECYNRFLNWIVVVLDCTRLTSRSMPLSYSFLCCMSRQRSLPPSLFGARRFRTLGSTHPGEEEFRWKAFS